MAPAKKTSTANPTANPPPPTPHPPYIEMITEAISLLKDRTGSSQRAIVKIMEEKYQNLLPTNYKKILSVQLKKFVKSGKLVKVKNSYKIEKSNPKPKPDSAPEVPHGIKSAKKVTAVKAVDKAVKMKRLSQVKTPDALKRKTAGKVLKVKMPSQVKTPQASKRKSAPKDDEFAGPAKGKKKISKPAKSAMEKDKN